MLCAACVLCFQLHCLAGENIALSWDASDPGASGFYINYGTRSQNYTSIVNAGYANHVVISNLTFGTTYYFAAQAYDKAGDKSALSPEVSFTAGSATLTPVFASRSFSIQGTAGKQYIVETSTNFTTWTPIYTNTAPFQFTNKPNPAITVQVFRAVRYPTVINNPFLP